MLVSDSQGEGILFVVSSPSGGGKGTLIRRALELVPGIGYSVSFTTRPARAGEIDGQDYCFVSADEFTAMIQSGEFLEWAQVHGNFYGTARSRVAQELTAGRDILLEIDVQGAERVREIQSSAVEIFILPPSFEVLRARLTARATENRYDLAVRLSNAPREVEHYREFDYVIINDEIARAAQQLAAVFLAERARRRRQEHRTQEILQTFAVTGFEERN